MSTLKKTLFFAALIGATVSMAAPENLAAPGVRLVVLGIALAAIALGVHAHRPRRPLSSHVVHPDPWVLIGLGLALRSAADLTRFFGGEDGIAEVLTSLFGLGMITLTGVALVGMIRQRFGDRTVDHCVEALITAGSLTMIFWIAVVEPVLRSNDKPLSMGIPATVAVFIALGLASLALHLVVSFTGRPPAFVHLGIGLSVPVLSSGLTLAGEAGGHSGLCFLALALTPLAVAGVGVAAMEPTMSLYEEPSGPAGARLDRWRLANLVVPVVIGPVVLILGLRGVLDLSPAAVAFFTVTLSLLVVGHLIGMVQARASSTHWASHDKLTGLPNRALFRERTARALERSRKMGTSVSVLYLDLDRFKNVNDSMGHEAGDQLLEQVARRIVSCCDAGDTVARLGGDEFAILLPSVDDDEIPRKLARRLLKTFGAPFNLKPRPVFMSPSVGIAMSEGNVSLETLLTQADTAMYRAKDSGRNNFAMWSQEMNEASRQRLMLETHLHSAIANDELRLVYQPKVQLATGKVVGVEALIRWHHPKLGVISPATFIHLAEESGLINQIGEWVLDTACSQARTWYDNGFTNLTMAVNLSSRQFQHQKVADLVSRVLRRTNLPSQLLELELTESVAMSGDDTTMTSLHELRSMGVRCAIDDFGTGYSNLSYLSRFPIDTLKIDKSFVQMIDKSGGDAAIVTAIIAMAHGLNLSVVAEGVETPEQASFLATHGCDEMQGFLFSKPLAPADIEGLFMLEHASSRPGRASVGFDSDVRRVERDMPDRERIADEVPVGW